MKTLILILFPIMLSAQWKVCERDSVLYGPITNTTGMVCENVYPATIIEAGREAEPYEDLKKTIELVGGEAIVQWGFDTVSIDVFKGRVQNVLRQRYKVFQKNLDNNIYLSDEDVNAVLWLLINETPKDSSALLTRFYENGNFVRQKRQLFRTGRTAINNATTYAELMNLYNQAMDL